jgi:hypothetical protein
VVCALTLGGCGGGGDGGGGGAEGNKGGTYDAAFDICAGGTKVTAESYAVEATPDAVADVVVELVAGGSPQDETSARQGCLDAINKADAG